jgi:hypothetical protein
MSGSDKYNIDLANRQVEINNWSYSNKMETLFVFQIMFISLLFVAILMLLKAQGVLGAAVVWYIMGILLLMIVLIIVNRAIYTNSIRDVRYWNKKHFADDYKKESPLARGDTSYLSYIDSIRKASGNSIC